MHAMRWLFEMLLQMNKCSSGLDQALEVIRIAGRGGEPEMLQDIVRLVIALLVPAAEEAAITGMPGNFRAGDIRRRSLQFLDET